MDEDLKDRSKTEYEYDKREKKQRLVRNRFPTAGSYDKILWVADGCVAKTEFAFGGKFPTSFCVEDLAANTVRFLLCNEDGSTVSSPFVLKAVS